MTVHNFLFHYRLWQPGNRIASSTIILINVNGAVMVTVSKTYAKIAPKLDEMLRRGFTNIELKIGANYEIYAHGEKTLLTKDFITNHPDLARKIPQDFPPDATVVVEDAVLLYKPRNNYYTKSLSETQLKHHQAFNHWCHQNVGAGKGYGQRTKKSINSIFLIGIVALIGLAILAILQAS